MTFQELCRKVKHRFPFRLLSVYILMTPPYYLIGQLCSSSLVVWDCLVFISCVFKASWILSRVPLFWSRAATRGSLRGEWTRKADASPAESCIFSYPPLFFWFGTMFETEKGHLPNIFTVLFQPPPPLPVDKHWSAPVCGVRVKVAVPLVDELLISTCRTTCFQSPCCIYMTP